MTTDAVDRLPVGRDHARQRRVARLERLAAAVSARAIARDSGPLNRTTPIPPRPGGVAIATIVSVGRTCADLPADGRKPRIEEPAIARVC